MGILIKIQKGITICIDTGTILQLVLYQICLFAQTTKSHFGYNISKNQRASEDWAVADQYLAFVELYTDVFS